MLLWGGSETTRPYGMKEETNVLPAWAVPGKNVKRISPRCDYGHVGEVRETIGQRCRVLWFHSNIRTWVNIRALAPA